MNIIGIDFGTKLVGVSISLLEHSIVMPLIVLKNDNNLFKNLKKIVDDEEIKKIIVGFPKTHNNYVSERHGLINSFISKLKNIFSEIDIDTFDESYSTIESKNIYQQFDVSKKNFERNKDATSACIILENYLKKQQNL